MIHTNNGHPFRSRSNDNNERECKGGGSDQIGIFRPNLEGEEGGCTQYDFCCFGVFLVITMGGY